MLKKIIGSELEAYGRFDPKGEEFDISEGGTYYLVIEIGGGHFEILCHYKPIRIISLSDPDLIDKVRKKVRSCVEEMMKRGDMAC